MCADNDAGSGTGGNIMYVIALCSISLYGACLDVQQLAQHLVFDMAAAASDGKQVKLLCSKKF